MFYDEAKIKIKAGDGGNGVVSFFRTKGITHGGPDGGDGGNGGDIYLESTNSENTLSDYIHQKEFEAPNGEPGSKQRCHGKEGDDIILKVPVGTVVFKLLDDKEVFLFDLNKAGVKVLLAKGGKGGFGNAHFTSSTRQSPKFAELGSPGEEFAIRLELQLIADVGLVGFPNCGKSTLLARVTSARPKIANYPFTTIVPNLGVVVRGKSSLVLADIPGLIEGASQGKGLGHEFLRHIKRTRLIVHIIDGLEDDWAARYKEIKKELGQFDKTILDKKELVAINKIDAISKEEIKEKLKKIKKLKLKKIYLISAVSGEGVKELFDDVFEIASKTPVPKYEVDQEKVFTFEDIDPNFFEVRKVKSGFRVYCKKLDYIATRTNFDNDEAVERLRDVMKKLGIAKAMEKQGINLGDVVWIGEKKIEW
ncbi:MAG TPA: GTPase ObgE [Patescibacteria group bacterium]|nr:GTPase ObgE [Patescibacteria group bacterium]